MSRNLAMGESVLTNPEKYGNQTHIGIAKLSRNGKTLLETKKRVLNVIYVTVFGHFCVLVRQPK